MARRKVEIRREEILAATIAHVERAGLAQTRVADVAASLGCSTGLVFYHFGTKDELLAAAFAHAVERDLARLDAADGTGTAGPDGTDALERLRRVVRLYGPTGQATGWKLWIDAWAYAQREPGIRRTLRRLDRRWSAVLRAVIDDGVADGSFTVSDPAAAVARISALLDGLSVAALVYGSVSRGQLRSWVVEAVASELGIPVAALA